MADISYSVLIDVSMRDNASGFGQLNSKLESARGGVDRLSLAAFRLGGELNSTFQRAVEHAGKLLEHIALLGAGAGIATLTYAVGKLDSQFEKMRIGMAGELIAEGVVKDVPHGLMASAALVTKMRADSAKLPVTFQDLATIFQNALIPGLKTGASVMSIEKMSTLVATLGAAVPGLGIGAASTGISLLLSGAATSRNPLARLLGITGHDAVKAFNAMAPEERFNAISKKLEGWRPIIDEFSNSFVGLFTTLKTNVGTFLEAATGPLFSRVKTTLKEINSWFVSHGGNVQAWADYIGVRLGIAFDYVKQKALEWGPTLIHFIQEAAHRVMHLAGALNSLFGGIRRSLESGDMLNKMESIGKLYMLSRVGSGVGGIAGSLMGMGGGAGFRGLGGLMAGGGSLGAGSSMGGIAGVAGAAAMTAMAGLFIGGVVGAVGALSGATLAAASGNKAATYELSQFSTSLNQLSNVLLNGTGFMSLFEKAGTVGVATMNMLSGKFIELAGYLGLVPHIPLTTFGHEEKFLEKHQKSSVDASTDLNKLKKALEGSGATNIGTVNFIISGSQEPTRIARVAAAHLADLARHRTTSPSVVNWSSKR